MPLRERAWTQAQFRRGLGVSLGLHGAVIAAFYPVHAAQDVPQADVTYEMTFDTLAPEPEKSADAAPPEQVASAAADMPPPPGPSEPPPVPVAEPAEAVPQTVLPRPAAPPVRKPPQRIRSLSPVAASIGAPPAAPAVEQAQSPPASVPAPVVTPPLGRPSAAWLAGVGAWLAAHRSYPDAARQHGQQGTVIVHFTVDRDGHVLDVTLVRGSGSDALDQAAEALLRQARLPPFPADMTLPQQSITVPIHYRLE